MTAWKKNWRKKFEGVFF